MRIGTVTTLAGGRAIQIRPLREADLDALLDLFSKAIPQQQLARSIYLARGARSFLAALLDHGALQEHEQLWGIEMEGEGLVAGAHTRRVDECHHLNNYAVLPAFQRQGIGHRMMTYWHELAAAQKAQVLSLDVDVENERAHRHYLAHGFRDANRTREYKFEGCVSPQLGAVQLFDWPIARAAFDTYGFGRFTLSTGSMRCLVDLREGSFRLSSTEPRLLAALQLIDPARTILVRTLEPLAGSSWRPTGSLIRMVKNLG